VDLVRQRNPGFAFGLLSAGESPTLLVLARGLVAVALLCWIERVPRGDRSHRFALAALLAGTLGNLADNLAGNLAGQLDNTQQSHGVRDFVLLSVGGRTALPAFNLADVYILLGASMLLVLVSRRRLRRQGAPTS
jgi:lipoprotein signal peptidase